MRKQVNRITTHRARNGMSFWRFHYADGSGHAILTENYRRPLFMERYEFVIELIIKMAPGQSFDFQDFTIVLTNGRNGAFVQDLTTPFSALMRQQMAAFGPEQEKLL